MFEIGFQELALVFIIALVVLGPEKLPRLARSFGQWAGRARSYLRHFTSELEREMEVQDARQQLGELKKEMTESVDLSSTPPSLPLPPPQSPSGEDDRRD